MDIDCHVAVESEDIDALMSVAVELVNASVVVTACATRVDTDVLWDVDRLDTRLAEYDCMWLSLKWCKGIDHS